MTPNRTISISACLVAGFGLTVTVAQAQTVNKPFEVLVQTKDGANFPSPMKRLRHTGVTIEGKSSSDISCEPRTQDSGRLRCVLERCDQTAKWASYYVIGFEKVQNWEQTTLAEVTVDKCEVTPARIEVSYSSAQHVYYQKVQDFGKIEDAMFEFQQRNGHFPSGSVVAEATLAELAREPDGDYRLAALRQTLQNAAQYSLDQKEPGLAAIYEGYARTTVNLSLKMMATKVSKDLAAHIVVDDSLVALRTNLDKLQTAKSSLPVEGAWNNALLNSVQAELRVGNLGKPQLQRFDRAIGLDGNYGNLPTPDVQRMLRR